MKFTTTISIVLITSMVSAAPLAQPKNKRAIDLGTCSDASIVFADGLDGRKEFSFQPADPGSFSHGSALNIGIITGFICSQLGSSCKAPAASVTACQAGAAAAASLKGQAAADAFNAAVGGNRAAAAPAPVPAADTTSGDSGAGDDVTDDNTDDGCDDTTDDTADDAEAGNGAGAGNGGAAGSGSLNLDFGKCTDPTMKFGGGFDGRPATENTFLPTNSDGFFGGQSSALNPNIIANFICDTFINRCDAGQDAIDACANAEAVVAVQSVRDASVADKFNAALGF